MSKLAHSHQPTMDEIDRKRAMRDGNEDLIPMTDDKQKEFEAVCRPVIKWLAENGNPHHTVIVTTTGAELLSGEMCTPQILDYVRD